MLRPAKFLTVLLASCLLFFTCLLLVSSPSTDRSTYTPRGRGRTRSSFLSFPGADNAIAENDNVADCQPANLPPTKVSRRLQQSSVPEPSGASTSSHREQSGHGQDREQASTKSTTSPSPLVGKQVNEGDPRYLMYVPYAGVTNQLISIWHASLIAKALNRTLLIPNLSPNVHVETAKEGEQPRQEPALTKWSEFFDLKNYSEKTGLQIEELDTFLARRGVVEKDSVAALTPIKRRRKRSLPTENRKAVSSSKRRNSHRKRWIQLIQEGHQISGAGASGSEGSESGADTFAFPDSTLPETPNTHSTHQADGVIHRTIKFPTVQKCFAEAGYGADRRIDMTGRRFMERYGIDSELIPTPYLDPERDNATIWARWRMDKVIERYQQPAYENEEVLCLGHVYRLLPGGNNRAWVEFGQHFRYTERVDLFVDEILQQLLPSSKLDTQKDSTSMSPPFVGIHLRRGDFYRHCLGITSPADPNGWNRCYPSTAHIISLLSTLANVPLTLPPADSRSTSTLLTQQQKQRQELQQKTPLQELPVLVLTNEHDPEELAKADRQNWIRVDHHRLGTLERFGRYGPILIDGALLARASLLVGVEYSTYFKTASKRAETWYGGNTVFVT
ncbi:hypothetical protein EMPS_06573 [Entomortierella parvispora]|uniref:GDP-fucose protein O-fucosyltransferase 2 n=1 Tax=Entomortierella parvispora TaxID=205924 RepID=A0A9P3LXV4_9FUNG|nr:hypothetical protein EMPS_06573 [Entomortierella parvispora]